MMTILSPRLAAACLALPLLAGCGAMGAVKEIGKAPPLSPMQAPFLTADGRAVRPDAAPVPVAARPLAVTPSLAVGPSLFRDLRAGGVGDIVTIRVEVDDSADMVNATTRSRAGSDSGGFSGLFGLEKLVKSLVGLDAENMIGASTKSQSSGSGSSKRKEKLSMTLAAVVTDVLPNGTLLIRGTQDIRVNYELRELIVMGLVNPIDIAPDNSVAHTRIAEMRMSYAGKGQISKAQQARWGQQLIEAVSPF